MNIIDHKDRVAIVTGGSGGIGLALARRMAREGAQIVIWDIDAGKLAALAQSDPGFFCQQVDITSESGIAAAVEAVLASYGRIDIMIAAAGISGPNLPVADYPLDLWNKVMAINLTGVYLCCKAVIGPMRKAGYGRIVNIASIAGKEGVPTVSCYSAAKAGVIAFTKAMAKEHVDLDIRINCVAPAAVETDLIKQMDPNTLAFVKAKIPMGRLGQPDEVAAMVSWLASQECSFSTGAVFDLSGGRATY